MHLTSTKERVFGLDLMRALAIILVLLGHCLWIYPSTNVFLTSIFQVFAFLGVEIFFVLSGFLIGSIVYRLYVDEEYSKKTVFYFLKRRWFRTLPTYYLVLLMNVLIAFFYTSLDGNVWRYFLFLQNFNGTMLPFFPESWSLSIEEFSYFLLPLALLLYKPKNRSLSFVVIISVLISMSLMAKMLFHIATNNTDINLWNAAVKSVVVYRLDAIFIGVLCSWIAFNFQLFWKKFSKMFCLFGILSMAFLFVGIGYFRILITTHPLFWNVFYLPLVSISIAFFLPILSQWKTFDSKLSKPITFISMISYSIYLLHYSIILQLMKSWIVIDPQNLLKLHIFTAVYIAITVTLSYFVYRFFEKPMMDLRDKN
ncbi:acyltransferase [Flavobacterium sp.]|uniref:acyltransferase family protein n=1 Tax=Flavobacterium sp. TaxID=239 RepID=UPI00286D2CDE|nr:acyltransferase [Flavobacterium sp.]